MPKISSTEGGEQAAPMAVALVKGGGKEALLLSTQPHPMVARDASRAH